MQKYINPREGETLFNTFRRHTPRFHLHEIAFHLHEIAFCLHDIGFLTHVRRVRTHTRVYLVYVNDWPIACQAII